MLVHMLILTVNVILSKIIYEYLLLLRMLVEILFKALIRNKLFLEFVGLLSFNSLIV